MGGQIEGNWQTAAESFNIATKEHMPISDLLVPVFGPSLVAVEDANHECILYCVGLDLQINKTIIQSWSEASNKWTIIKDNIVADLKFGFSALIYAN